MEGSLWRIHERARPGRGPADGHHRNEGQVTSDYAGPVAWDDDLDPRGPHYAIAASTHHRVGILAGPGTGKTAYGLMRRIARLLEQQICAPEEILALTFTRTAAQDLVSKLEDIGSPGANRVASGTIHGFCLGLLQKQAVLTATGRQLRMLLEHEEEYLLRDLGDAFGDMDAREKLLRAFEAGWARGESEHPGAPSDPTDQSFDARVMSWLRHHRAMLIGEVVPLAYQYLKDNPYAEERTKFRHIIVDEYQDLNTLEQRLADLLVGPDASLCIAGDDDQSIYRFRWAHPEGVHIFVTDPATERHDITECRRCPAPVLDIANALMKAAPGRNKADLICRQATRGQLDIVQWDDLSEEIQGLVSAVVSDVNQGHRQPGDFIVLVNRRKVGYRIKDALVAQDVAARSFFQDDALRRSSSAQGGLAILRLLGDPDDRPSLRVWLGLEDADGRAKAYARLRQLAESLHLSEYETMVRVQQKQIGTPSVALSRRFQALQDVLAGLVDQDLAGVVDVLFPATDPDLASVRELAQALIPTVGTPRALAEELVKAITQPEVPQSPDFVRVMSLHKSKGLTSPVVILATAVDGVVPTLKSNLSDEEREASYNEQRRLFFVAITRSSDELVISGPKRMAFADARGVGARIGKSWRRGGELIAECFATPYLRELGEHQPASQRGLAWLSHRTQEK